ncbi:MAG: entericidin EcnA/B family protein [Phenylobacterium sp.]|nr:entericidin EcnA/B family protein [Phenylobacterium sp.]MDO9430754.1 entericidin EcnA/B family protein [Phenylobacterium sp.]
MRKIIILTVTAAALLTAACNTVAGIGRDAQAAGAAVSGVANDMKR